MKTAIFGACSVFERKLGHPDTNSVKRHGTRSHRRPRHLCGGPLHGQKQHLESAPQQLWRELPDGAALLYACRMQSDAHAVYAPVGMSEHAFLDLLPTVERNTA